MLTLRWNTLTNWTQPLIVKKLASYTFSTLPWSRCTPKMLPGFSPLWAEQQTRRTAGKNWQTDALPLQSKRTEADSTAPRGPPSRAAHCFGSCFSFSASSLSGRDSADSSRDQSFCSFFVLRVSGSRICTRRYWQNPLTSQIISFIGASVCSAGATSMLPHVPCYTVTWCTNKTVNYQRW